MEKTFTNHIAEIEYLNCSGPFARAVLDSLSAYIAILDENGVIIEANRAWINYAAKNQAQQNNDFIGTNYLTICDAATGEGAEDAHKVAAGIRSVIAGDIEEFLYDYPCHTPSLLPKSNPNVEGLDVAAKSIYCDETGGDYHDFIDFRKAGQDKLGVLIGDVSGHGISSALLMATVRSAIRQRSRLPGNISQILSDVNRQLAQDVDQSGRFVTLFFMAIEPKAGRLKWVRSGHEPAIYYNQELDKFEELKGSGLALGIDENSEYEENEKTGLAKGDIIVLLTDGIFEACNSKGEMFGKEAIYRTIRENSTASADKIMDAILKTVYRFRDGAAFEDDVTLTVIKIDKDLKTSASRKN